MVTGELVASSFGGDGYQRDGRLCWLRRKFWGEDLIGFRVRVYLG